MSITSKISTIPESVQEFRKSFTKKQDDAIWQYLMDHSEIQKNGYWKIYFYIRDRSDFWRRVWARYNKDFERYDLMEKERVQISKQLKLEKRALKTQSEEISRIETSGTFKEKLLLSIYRFTYRKIFKYKEISFHDERLGDEA